jgi:hypothetical protein
VRSFRRQQSLNKGEKFQAALISSAKVRSSRIGSLITKR